MTPLIECVPNFSEGCRQNIIREVVDAICLDGIDLLHQTSDPDHNRTVVTFTGSPDKVLDAAFEGVKAAATLIDLEVHRGVHPRLGAMDVVPFVPLQGATMEDCVILARKLGQQVGDELGLPVYLYGAAAIRPERESLATIRRGEYEKLKNTITFPERYPDYGPAKLGRAGAVVIGARPPLIAFNIFLTTDDVAIARSIARIIRYSSGGLPGVQALGLRVANRAQVSMNLIAYKQTPLHRVVEIVRMEAAKFGVGIYKTELIGLIPKDAILDAAAWYLQLHDFQNQQVLDYVSPIN